MIYFIGIAFALLALDWAQTLRIAREPERFYEKWNLFLPQHPSSVQVNLYFCSFAAICAFLTWTLWSFPLTLGALASILAVVEAICVIHNWRIGIRT